MILQEEKKKYQYVEQGKGKVLLLLHGLFGTVDNWESVLNYFSPAYKVVIPKLPIHTLPIKEASLEGLVSFLESFIAYKQYKNLTIVGNSMDGHIAIIYTLKNSVNVKQLVLTGSSGLFENTMGDAYLRRGDYAHIKKLIEYTFFDPKTVDKHFIDEIFKITNNVFKAIRIVKIAKSVRKNNMADKIMYLKQPTLLIWGLNDTITPPKVAHEFSYFIPNTKLRFINECCHAPMMEQSEKFNVILENFLQQKDSL